MTYLDDFANNCDFTCYIDFKMIHTLNKEWKYYLNQFLLAKDHEKLIMNLFGLRIMLESSMSQEEDFYLVNASVLLLKNSRL